jgi:hypothetical protein
MMYGIQIVNDSQTGLIRQLGYAAELLCLSSVD